MWDDDETTNYLKPAVLLKGMSETVEESANSLKS